jgi:hypothetical protein
VKKKLKVFVSHSFDRKDKTVVSKFLDLLKQPVYNFEVRTAEPHESRPFPDKIRDYIRWADVTLGIFTRKHQITGSDGRKSYVPPSFVVSECSYASGVYDGTHRTVHGFVEDGIDYDHIGLNVSSGEEFPRFNRAEVGVGKLTKIKGFLRDMNRRHFDQSQASRYPYIQLSVRKTVHVYRDGSGLVKNTVQAYVRDAHKVETAGGIPHEIWLPSRDIKIPALAQMSKEPVSHRFAKPFFFAVLLSVGGKSQEQPLEVTEIVNSGTEMRFVLKFPMSLKDHDHLEYQYVWGMPGMFDTAEEQLKAREIKCQEVSLRSNYGEVRQAVLRVRFERANIQGLMPEIFSKTPYMQFTPSTREDSAPYEDAVVPISISRDAVFLTFEHSYDRLLGSMTMRWVPISQRRLTSYIPSASSELGEND